MENHLQAQEKITRFELVEVFYMCYRDLLKKLFIMTLGRVTIFLGLDNPDSEFVSGSSLICAELSCPQAQALRAQVNSRFLQDLAQAP